MKTTGKDGRFELLMNSITRAVKANRNPPTERAAVPILLKKYLLCDIKGLRTVVLI